MPCIAGTPSNPRSWFRLRGGDEEELFGRICTRTQERTDRAVCSSCPAYRGRRWDTTEATGIAVDGSPYSLTPEERDGYTEAMNAALIDDDFDPITRWEARMTGGVGDRTLIAIGDPDALERWAARMREYRAGWNEAQRARNREQSRVRMARMRARRAVTLAPRAESLRAGPISSPMNGRARAREAPVHNVTSGGGHHG